MQRVEAKSYGIIPIFKNKDGFYVLLVKNSKGGHWGLPKGTPEKDEEPIDTATRKLFEETGIKNIEIIGSFKEKIHYFYKVNNELMSKDVIFYLAKAKTEEVKLSFEHIGFAWLSFDKAMEKLTYRNAKDILKKAHEFLKMHKTLDDF